MPVDVSQALDLRVNHKLPYSQIADIQGTSKQAVHRAIKDLLPPADIKVFQDNRADILSGLQAKLLSHVDEARLKKAPVGSLVLAACQLYDKERLERGMSTANLASLTSDIAQIKRSKVVDNSGNRDGPTGK